VSTPAHIDLLLEPDDPERIASVNGAFDAHLRQIELKLGIEVRNRGNFYRLLGPEEPLARGQALLESLFELSLDTAITTEHVHLALLESTGTRGPSERLAPLATGEVEVRTRRGLVRGRTAQQKAYLQAIATHDVSFGIGPAGTGKTYLAMAKAVQALQAKHINRIILTRPAVEAGESLGYLPGTLSEKIDPYLRPLYDALHDMIDPDTIPKLMAAGTIEVAPLAYMRGRSLNDSFIILDEAQNTTPEQMKMFLTRLGFGSKIVVTGDVTQVDLPNGAKSGLRIIEGILDEVEDIAFNRLTSNDVVRHRLVGKIVAAYDEFDAENQARLESRQGPTRTSEQRSAEPR